jgi:heme/copper-type cytochrome/quinol oxidase subunit 2
LTVERTFLAVSIPVTVFGLVTMIVIVRRRPKKTKKKPPMSMRRKCEKFVKSTTGDLSVLSIIAVTVAKKVTDALVR